MKVLFFGDIVGEIGFKAVSNVLPRLVNKLGVDFVIANGENLSKGRGLTYKDYRSLIELGVDAVTLGNHWHSKDQIDHYIKETDNLIRPANLLHYDRGVGTAIFDLDGVSIQVTNLLGQAFMQEEVANPYETIDKILEDSCPIHVVDFHGESTSEKSIFAHYVDGRVSAVLGTHTHVQTNDCHILPGGTAFQSDVGFSGDMDSVIGFDPDSAIAKFVYHEDTRFILREDVPDEVDCTLLEIDEEIGACLAIRPITIRDGKEVVYEPYHL